MKLFRNIHFDGPKFSTDMPLQELARFAVEENAESFSDFTPRGTAGF